MLLCEFRIFLWCLALFFTPLVIYRIWSYKLVNSPPNTYRKVIIYFFSEHFFGWETELLACLEPGMKSKVTPWQKDSSYAMMMYEHSLCWLQRWFAVWSVFLDHLITWKPSGFVMCCWNQYLTVEDTGLLLVQKYGSRLELDDLQGFFLSRLWF